ncbi:MAG: hypothetical protein COT38_04330 [Candidatus Omnitrophica bacterium CG08_land_8_20_14_0_20_41_16]|uniref:Uncharacterized protein n=1 Tax=Candidatus Sherwoodlollariibacterium unditelluris TaxID=1974757 RepID=A0A2G9YLJ9_9BACT|nr:MAG: hypothetical protein COX41_03205 [Candidatus Omnitrophica bacterium CG23_combo_of_CG06-09_8_20_14_all_41_10]PIS33629.1 MAG: hypothetical protein COT38_04330 [Candidatus Omnitrophica bacterium CG08_land_8_20_14_0_20_41_16]
MATKHTTYFNLLDALKEQGCHVCFVIKKNAQKFMVDFLYESVNDSDLRKEIKESVGFCNRHAWQFHKFGDGFGLGIVYEDLMRLILKRLEEVDGSSASLKAILKQLDKDEQAKKSCIVCKEEKDVEGRYISVFLDNFDDPELKFAYENSFGLCLRHLNLAIKKNKNKKLTNEIIAFEAAKFNGLIAEVKEFLRKHDYRFSKEKFGKEGDSWIRAIEKLIGKEGVY